jgi:hypothetical protein
LLCSWVPLPACAAFGSNNSQSSAAGVEFTFAFAFSCCFAVVVTFLLSWLLLAYFVCDLRRARRFHHHQYCDPVRQLATARVPVVSQKMLGMLCDNLPTVPSHKKSLFTRATRHEHCKRHATTLEGDKSYHCADYRRLDFPIEHTTTPRCHTIYLDLHRPSPSLRIATSLESPNG